MKNILFLTDFSDNAKYALQYGLSLYGDEPSVKFILIHTVYLSYSSPNTSASPVDVRTEGARIAFKELLSDIENDFPKNDFQITTDIMSGEVVDITALLVKKMDVDVVIMGTHGVSGIAEVFIGSNTAAVIRHVNCTILAVPNTYIFKNIQKIALGWDEEKKLNDQTLQPVLELAGKFNANIYAVNVSSDPSRSYTDRLKLKNELPPSVTINYVKVFDKDVVKGLTEYSKSSNADLLCVINQKLKFIERIFHKSISKQLAITTDIPILIMNKK